MPADVISPNYHVLLLHFPIALLVAGLVGEIIGWAWPRHGLRAAARWMVVLGALLAVPAVYSGIYAFRDVLVKGDRIVVAMNWPRVVEAADWPRGQWHFMTRHIQYNAAAAAAFVLVAVGWLASGRSWSDRLPWWLVVLLLAGVGLMTVGAWFGGEGVYRYGTGVDDSQAGVSGWRHYLPPLQWHVVGAGFVATFVLLCLGLLMRRAYEQRRAGGQGTSGEVESPAAPATNTHALWAMVPALVAGLVVVAFGALSVWPEVSGEAIGQNLTLLAESLRLILHVIVGLGIVVLLVVVAWRTWRASPQRLTIALAGVLLALLAMQTYLGVLMLYDSHHGSLFGFSDTASAAGHDHATDQRATTRLHAREHDTGRREDAGPVEVTMKGLRYQPDELTIRQGQTVRWRNTTSIMHTVTADPAKASQPDEHVALPEGAQTFDSGQMQPGEAFEHTFKVPGRYKYFCIPHEAAGMVGSVEVTPVNE
jgi:plastocyanin